MDLVIRGRSQDQREERGRGTRGGPEWSQAGQDHRAWEDQRGARQDRTRGHGGESRESPREQEAAAAAAVGECTPEGARCAGHSSSTQSPSLKQLQQSQIDRASKPASDEGGERAHKSSSFTSLKQGVGLYIG